MKPSLFADLFEHLLVHVAPRRSHGLPSPVGTIFADPARQA